ncbi:MAG: hypothetical protein WD200_04080 [Candidatus Andersenbacteria bacterium]
MTSTTQIYWDEIKRRLPLALLASFVVGVAAYVVAINIEPTYQVHFSYIVSLSEREAPQEYTFDGYYALQATDLFAATLAKWAQTPEVIVAAFESAQVPLQTEDPHQVSRIVRAEKTAPQLVQVTVSDATEARTRAVANSLQQVMQQNIERYHAEGIPALQFRVVTTDSWVGKTAVSVPIITIAAFVLVLFLGFNLILLLVAARPGIRE